MNNSFLFIIIMIMTGVMSLIGTDIYAPSLPLLPHLFNATTTLAQLTITTYLIGYSIAQLIAGMLSDTLGRRPILIVGLVIFLLATIACMYSPSILFLITARTIQGVGAGAVSVMSRILLRDKYSGDKLAQVASFLAIFISSAPALAPIIGGLIQQQFGFSTIFLFLLLFAALLFYLIQFYLPETNQ